jgi:hypothetical protein
MALAVFPADRSSVVVALALDHDTTVALHELPVLVDLLTPEFG